MKLHLKENISLKVFNTFGVEANARYFAEIQSAEDFLSLLQSKAQDQSMFILGGGSNILFTQDVNALVVKNNIKGITTLKENDEHVWLNVGAGESWHDLVLHTIDQGYQGLENLSLIPGLVGAAPIQNIGAYGVELKDRFEALNAINIENGQSVTLNNHDCQFGYRDSVFKRDLKNKFLITHVTLRLNKQAKFNLEYPALYQAIQGLDNELSLKLISDTVSQIRRSKLPDPKEIGNAGSFFKNPYVSEALFKTLREKHTDIPYFEVDTDNIKIPAAWLIEQCGWKGKRFHEAAVHDKQALVLVNPGNAQGKIIQQLSEEIQKSVYEKFAIQLETEVNII